MLALMLLPGHVAERSGSMPQSTLYTKDRLRQISPNSLTQAALRADEFVSTPSVAERSERPRNGRASSVTEARLKASQR